MVLLKMRKVLIWESFFGENRSLAPKHGTMEVHWIMPPEFLSIKLLAWVLGAQKVTGEKEHFAHLSSSNDLS